MFVHHKNKRLQQLFASSATHSAQGLARLARKAWGKAKPVTAQAPPQ